MRLLKNNILLILNILIVVIILVYSFHFRFSLNDVDINEINKDLFTSGQFGAETIADPNQLLNEVKNNSETIIKGKVIDTKNEFYYTKYQISVEKVIKGKVEHETLWIFAKVSIYYNDEMNIGDISGDIVPLIENQSYVFFLNQYPFPEEYKRKDDIEKNLYELTTKDDYSKIKIDDTYIIYSTERQLYKNVKDADIRYSQATDTEINSFKQYKDLVLDIVEKEEK